MQFGPDKHNKLLKKALLFSPDKANIFYKELLLNFKICQKFSGEKFDELIKF